MFAYVSEAWNNDPVKEMTDKLSKGKFIANSKSSDSKINPSDINSSSLMQTISDDLEPIDLIESSDYRSYAPVNFDTKLIKKRSHKSKKSECDLSIRHIKSCEKCSSKLKKLVDSKVNEKFDDIILAQKMKQLESFTPLQQTNAIQSNNKSDFCKETLIIVAGAIIAIFILFLMIKAVQK